MDAIGLTHIINPVGVAPQHPLFEVQKITFESIKNAARYSEKATVQLLTAQHAEDRNCIPEGFFKTADLTQSVQDVGQFSKPTKYPLIADILQKALENSSHDYIVFSNMDIGLMPHFYDFVAGEIKAHGYDAMLITRRRIGLQYKNVAQLPAMYADLGKPHPGYDMFVMHRSVVAQLVLDKICVGVPFLEVSLLHNLVAFAQNLKLYDTAHLTFHIGMEVMPPVNPSFYWHNRNSFEKQILPRIKPLLLHKNFPYSELSFWKRMFKWGLNPCYRTALMLEMEKMDLKRKIKFLLDEVRWWVLQGR
jgi:hypothetical protein